MGMLREMLRPAFPPYELGSAVYVREAQEKYARLEKLYHLAQSRSWNGKQVLPELIQKHGGVKIDPDKRGPPARGLSGIMWGGLAAWVISPDLAGRIADVQ